MAQTYSQYQPTGFDPCGLGLPDRQDWLVASVMQTRDSEALDLSNFDAALRILGGESETVEVHRFGHWGPGWVEIILVHPDRAREVVEIESALENYPVLDDEDLSRREYEEYEDDWGNWAAADMRRLVSKHFKLSAEASDYLWELEPEVWRELYERYHTSETSVSGRSLEYVVNRQITRSDVAGLIRRGRKASR